MDLNKYLFPLRKWWWLILASVMIAGIFGYLAVRRQPAVYQAHATLMIGTTINNPNPTSNEFTLGQQLAATYADIANRETVRNATMNALGVKGLPGYIARAIPNSQLIEIIVSDTNPERAQIVANELAAQLVLLSPTSAQNEEQGRQDFINQQLNNLEIQISATEEEIERLQQELGDLVSAAQIEDTQEQVSALESKLNSLRENYAALLSNTQKGAFNSLTVIEPAANPGGPIAQNKSLSIILAMLIGFVLAAGEAYLLEYMNDTLRTAEDAQRIFSVPVVGHIFEQDFGKNDKQLYDASNLRHPGAEAFRTLRTTIEFAGEERPLKTILVTSADIGDGKTSVAANLALSISLNKKKVVLLDGDLRKPKVHEFFDLPNDKGLVNLLDGDLRGPEVPEFFSLLNDKSAVDPYLNRAVIEDALRFKRDKNIALLAAGSPPPNPTELLSSSKMDLILSELKEVADVVIIDGPPFVVADAMVIARKVDGVLIVVRPGHTRQSLARVAAEKMKLAEVRLIGVVLNRIPRRGADYYAGKNYLASYSLSSYGMENGDRKKKHRNGTKDNSSSNGK